MPRQSRLVLPDVAIHVIQRGNNRSACFVTDSDRLLYLLHLRELSKKFSCAVHAYCLMPNHVHLIAVPQSADGLGRAIGEAHRRYTRLVNFREG